MPRNNVLTQLLQQDGLSHPNTVLLKKYLLCLHQGWFRVNGGPPDEQFSLGDYLLDDERIVLDFSRLSEQGKTLFFEWFLVPHQDNASRAFLSGVKTTDYRGYTAEVELSWWGRITNLLFYKKKSWQWQLAPLNLLPNAQLAINYQLNGLEICEGERGLLLGLNQLGGVTHHAKYQSPDSNQEEPLRNTKRVHLTDALVKQLASIRLDEVDYPAMVHQPHPYAIPVTNSEQYFQAMQEHRVTQRFVMPSPWYKRLWRWMVSLFSPANPDREMHEIRNEGQYTLIAADETVEIYQRKHQGDVLVVEKRPDLNSMVFSGGGAKIFGHVGAFGEFEKAGVTPLRYAGSSAGAIMALLGYLGYASPEILAFFQRFREDNLVHYNIDRSGLSDTRAVRAALDFMIIQKINQIITRYDLKSTAEGQYFLDTEVFPDGKITFESLQKLKDYCPDCEIGEHLVVTATNVRERKTRYFSCPLTSDTELSVAVTLSASFPVLFKPTLFNGDPHNDGGVLNGLPTEAYRDDNSTLLESEYGNCLSLVAFQFDNGPERGILDRLVDRVYRENFILNWFYGLLTGVRDPVSGWERDRLKLLQHSNQTVLIPVGNVSATQFDVDIETQNRLLEQGRSAAADYINTRYKRDPDTGKARNDECQHATFSGIEEVLYYACYRKNVAWFRRLADIAVQQGVSDEKISALWREHFASRIEADDESDNNDEGEDDCIVLRTQDAAERHTLFSAPLSVYHKETGLETKMRLFEAIYPVFLDLPYAFFANPRDLKWYKSARHSFSLHNPFACLADFDRMRGDVHVLFAMLVQLIKALQQEDADIAECCDRLAQIATLLRQGNDMTHASFYGRWSLLDRQYDRVVTALLGSDTFMAVNLCDAFRRNEEPMDYIYNPATDDRGDLCLEGSSSDDEDRMVIEDSRALGL